jgi:L-threonylcarbamoyladenylate synthase
MMMQRIIDITDVHAVQEVVSTISKGKLVIMPCDTIYGIVGKVDESYESLMMIKGRPETKPFIMLATLPMVHGISALPIDNLLLSYWPGPITAIVASHSGEGIAVRVPSDPYLLKVLEALNCPVYSTSVNISGEPALLTFSDILTRFYDAVPLMVRGSEIQGTLPSTIIDVREHPYRLIRQGVADVTELIALSSKDV